MAKQIKVVHDVHIAWSRYASTSIIESKPSKGTQINYNIIENVSKLFSLCLSLYKCKMSPNSVACGLSLRDISLNHCVRHFCSPDRRSISKLTGKLVELLKWV